MKSYRLISLLFILLFFKVNSYGQVDEILSKMQHAAQSVKTIKASLSQEKRHTQIGGKESYSGEMLFKKGAKGFDKLRINYSRPEGQVVSVIGSEITLYQANIKHAFKTTRQAQASKNQEFSFIATPYASISQLKTNYNIQFLREENNASVLELTPKFSSAAKKVTVWIDQGLWLPVKYQIVEKNDDISTFTLGNLRKNPELPDSSFPINLPKGTRITKQ